MAISTHHNKAGSRIEGVIQDRVSNIYIQSDPLKLNLHAITCQMLGYVYTGEILALWPFTFHDKYIDMLRLA